jgi:hypothetical protein
MNTTKLKTVKREGSRSTRPEKARSVVLATILTGANIGKQTFYRDEISQ